MKSLIQFIVATAVTVLSAGAMAQAPSYGADINLETARKIGVAALAECRKNKWNVAVAVVDNHGALVYYERMDDTQTASPRIAIAKARTAAMFRRPSKALEDGIAGGRVALLGLPGATPIDGGLPIVVGGKITGGVGVSGVQSHEDAQCARAGLEAVK
jgi:uncharacterized protein GlcG (DUF336 family)